MSGYGGMKFQEDIHKKDDEDPAVKLYREHVKRIEHIISYRNDFRQAYGEEGIKEIQTVYVMIKKHMDSLIKDVEFNVGQEQATGAHRVLLRLRDALLFKPVTDLTRDLAIELSKLIYNWNAQGLKNTEIANECQNLDLLGRGHLTMVQTIKIMQDLIAQAKRTLQWKPPAFELSRHYLSATNEKEKEDAS